MNYMYDKWSDENILGLVREQHDELAFEVLYNRYFKSLFNYAYSKIRDQFAAQEIIQELFVNLWQQRERMHADCCRSLLFTIAKRQVISFYRKEFTRRRHYDQWTIHQPGYEETANQSALVSDLEHRYRSGLHLLPPRCQEVFVLSRQGFANKQIARQLLISEKTVEQHITKALRILMAHMINAFIISLIFKKKRRPAKGRFCGTRLPVITVTKKMNLRIPPALLQKYLLDQCTDEEKAQVETWYESLQGQSAFLDQLPDSDAAEIRNNILSDIKNKLDFEQEAPASVYNWHWLTSIAASLLLASGIYFFYNVKNKSRQKVVSAKQIPNQAAELITFRNEEPRIDIHKLPDHSSVAMHPDAVIIYEKTFDADQRTVNFSGEGFFDIQKDPSHPFLIVSGELAVRVLGTSFNVKAPTSKEIFQVDVVRGSVEVSARGKAGDAQQVILKPKEQALFELGSGKLISRMIPLQLKKPIYEPVTVVFEETPMLKVVEQLEKRFDVKFSFSNPGIAQCSVTANFESHPLNSILEMLCTTLEASYSMFGNTITISGAPCE